jgi:glycosyltransferase involved in cell wall biosynthesis
MRAFIVSGFNKNSHTFIRSDFTSLSEIDWKVIDVEEYSFKNSDLVERARGLTGVVLLAMKFLIPTVTMMANFRGGTTIHGMFVAARILRSFEPTCSEIRTHFLGKACVASWFISRVWRTSYSLVCHGSDLYSSPSGYNVLLSGATRIDCVTYFGTGFVYGRIGAHASGKTRLKRNRISESLHQPPESIYSNFVDRHDVSLPHTMSSLVETLRCVVVARLVPQKDISFALEVVRAIKDLGTRVTYEIVGDGFEREKLVSKASALDIAGEVSFKGELSHSNALQLLARSEALILPCLEGDLTNADGLPVVFQEATALNVPVFCRRVYGVSELVMDNINGLSFDADATADDWARGILSFFAKRESR